MNQFKLVPIEMIEKILYKLSPDDLRDICLTDKNIREICNNDKFWRNYFIMNNYDETTYERYKYYVNKYDIMWDQLISDDYKYIEIMSDDKSFLQKITPDMKIEDFNTIVKILFRVDGLSGNYTRENRLYNDTIAVSFPPHGYKISDGRYYNREMKYDFTKKDTSFKNATIGNLINTKTGYSLYNHLVRLEIKLRDPISPDFRDLMISSGLTPYDLPIHDLLFIFDI